MGFEHGLYSNGLFFNPGWFNINCFLYFDLFSYFHCFGNLSIHEHQYFSHNDFDLLILERERGKEREKERWICSTYLCIHWSFFVCALTRNQTCNLGILGGCSNLLSNPTRTIFSSFHLFHLALQTPSPPIAASLFSMSLFLFCLLVYFTKWTLHMSEIILLIVFIWLTYFT